MLLRLIEVEGDYHHERDLPNTDSYTIGRGGDVRPTIDAANLLSRIAVTILKKDGKAIVSWRVLNGSEKGPSKSGLWISETQTVDEYTLSEVGQSIDLICPTYGLPSIKIVVGSAYRKSEDFNRNTSGFELEMLATIHEEIAGLKISSKEQEKFRDDNKENASNQNIEIAKIKEATEENSSDIKEILVMVKVVSDSNEAQDHKIKSNGWIVKVLAAIVTIGLTSAMVDGKNREIILQSTAGLLIAGTTLVAATKEK